MAKIVNRAHVGEVENFFLCPVVNEVFVNSLFIKSIIILDPLSCRPLATEPAIYPTELLKK